VSSFTYYAYQSFTYFWEIGSYKPHNSSTTYSGLCVVLLGLVMGNTAKRQRLQNGISRPGSTPRAAEAAYQEERRCFVVEVARERKALQRARQRAKEALSQQLASEQGVEDHMIAREMNRISLCIAQYIVGDLRSCPGPSSRRDVLERVMHHNIVWPLLPTYYPRPQEAKVINNFIENFKHELQLVKVANSNEFLVRKSALLDAAISLGIDGVAALSRVLDTST
jgi:hypothetical protein